MARLLSSLFFNFFLLLLLLLLRNLFLVEANSEQRKQHVAMFIFGDSFLDAGNNNYINTTTLDQANFWPYGETYFNFPTGRFSDGRLLSDFIAEYANLPLIPPFLQPGIDQYLFGVNFASAGAGALVETFKGYVIDLKTQVRHYKKVEKWARCKLGNDEANSILSKAVYLFSIGSNDYMSLFLTNSTLLNSFSIPQYVGRVLAHLTQAIKEIYEIGGRKFAFINLPALGCVPGMRIIKPENNGRCLVEATFLAALHNQALRKLLLEMENKLMGFKYSLFDLNATLQQRMNYPSKYGFKEGKAACCGTGEFRGVNSCGGKRIVKQFELCSNPNEYLFWDSFHFTDKFNNQSAHLMWATQASPSIGPHNLYQLFRI